MATTSLVLGIIGLVTTLFCQVIALVVGPTAIVLGIVARNRIRASQGTLDGNGQALAGIITGAIASALVALFVVLLIIYVMFSVWAVGSGHVPTPTPSS